MGLIYKILDSKIWDDAVAAGRFEGSAIDLKDGFIHFSDASQAEETAARHFHGQTGLVIAAFDDAELGDALQWEASRGGALFPHLYAVLNASLVKFAAPLPWDGGKHVFPAGWRG